MADNLESYFKKHLSKATPADDNWNVPSDDVWEKVLPGISKKKGLFIPWKYLYILVIIILAGLAYFLWPFNNVDTSTREESLDLFSIEENQETLQNISNENVTNADNIEKENINFENVIAEHSNAPTESSSSAKEPSQIVELNSNPSNDVSVEQSGQKSIQKTSYQNISSPESLARVKDQIEIALLSTKTIDFSPPETGTSLLKAEDITLALPVDIEKINTEPFNNKNKFGIGIFFKPTFTSTYLNGEMNSGFMETGNMYLYVSNWGVEAKYYISNKFALVAGVEKSEIRSWSKSLVDFGYDSSTEHLMGNGEKENTSPVPMPTPFGEINTEITYRFPDSQNIPDGEVMNSVLETHQEIRYLSIPLGLEYHMMRFSHINWFTEGGLAYNRALRDGTSFSSRILHEGHDMDVVGEIMTSQPSFTLNYLNFYVGTGVSYQFSKAFQINGSARYFGSITKVNLQENLSTYVHGFNFKIGIVYIF